MIDQQEYIFAKQNHRQHRLRDKVDWCITDSPILLSYVYPLVNRHQFEAVDEWPALRQFLDFVAASYDTYENINIYLERDSSKFQQHGRDHDLQQSIAIDEQTRHVLRDLQIDTAIFKVEESVVDNILKWIKVTT